MEKKLNRILNGLVILALSVAPCVSANSMEAASSNEQEAHSSSQLSLEDLETLLKTNHAPSSLQGLQLSELSQSARTQLLAKLKVLKKEKTSKIASVRSKSDRLKKNLREERRAIQEERVRTYGPMDEKAKMRLFSNLLEEANADAIGKNEVQNIEQEYLVTIIHNPMNGDNQLHRIATQNTNLWTSTNNRNIAQNN